MSKFGMGMVLCKYWLIQELQLLPCSTSKVEPLNQTKSSRGVNILVPTPLSIEKIPSLLHITTTQGTILALLIVRCVGNL